LGSELLADKIHLPGQVLGLCGLFPLKNVPSSLRLTKAESIFFRPSREQLLVEDIDVPAQFDGDLCIVLCQSFAWRTMMSMFLASAAVSSAMRPER
jgi:hypothetical protein